MMIHFVIFAAIRAQFVHIGARSIFNMDFDKNVCKHAFPMNRVSNNNVTSTNRVKDKTTDPYSSICLQN